MFFCFLIRWLQRKCEEFLPGSLHFVGTFPISIQGHLALLEISGLPCSRFSTSARDALGKTFHINV